MQSWSGLTVEAFISCAGLWWKAKWTLASTDVHVYMMCACCFQRSELNEDYISLFTRIMSIRRLGITQWKRWRREGNAYCSFEQLPQICCFAQHHRLDFSIFVFGHFTSALKNFKISFHDSALCHCVCVIYQHWSNGPFTTRTITIKITTV